MDNSHYNFDIFLTTEKFRASNWKPLYCCEKWLGFFHPSASFGPTWAYTLRHFFTLLSTSLCGFLNTYQGNQTQRNIIYLFNLLIPVILKSFPVQLGGAEPEEDPRACGQRSEWCDVRSPCSSQCRNLCPKKKQHILLSLQPPDQGWYVLQGM